MFKQEAIVNEIDIMKNPPAIKDDGRVRMGYVSPAFPPVRAAPEKVSDSGKVRVGYVSPAFPPPRAR